MGRLVLSPPSPKQEIFLTACKKYIAYGGARGGGKSWSVRVKAVLLCLKYAGIKVMIIRSTYPELNVNHIRPLCSWLCCYAKNKDDRLAKYNDTSKLITFPNGSTIQFGYCASVKDVDRYQGTEVDCLFIDEATHQPEEVFTKLKAIVRGVNSFPKRIYLTCNPGGIGHSWVKRLFIDRIYKVGENEEDYIFIPARVDDNIALMRENPDYKRDLEGLPEKLRRAWLDGDWNIFEGQFFEEYCDAPSRLLCEKAGITTDEAYMRRVYTHVIRDFDIPSSWKIYRSFDWGYSKPFSCGWWAVDHDGTVYRILELYGCTATPNEGLLWNPAQVFSRIAEIERTHRYLRGKTIEGVADPAIWDAQRGESIFEVAERYGVYFIKGDNSRISGWMQLHYRLQFDGDGYPSMYIFESCKAFRRTIPTLLYDEHRVEDLDTSGEDHVADETRYFLMTRPIKPLAVLPDDPFYREGAFAALDITEEDLRR